MRSAVGRYMTYGFHGLIVLVAIIVFFLVALSAVLFWNKRAILLIETLRKGGACTGSEYDTGGEWSWDEEPNPPTFLWLQVKLGEILLPSWQTVFVPGEGSDPMAYPSVWGVEEVRLNEQQLTAADLERLAWLRRLRHIVVDAPSAGNEVVWHLAQVPGLRRLVLSGTSITDDGVRYLAAVEGLEELLLARTKVTDEGLRSLAGAKQLTELDLSGTQVTDAGLEHLVGLTGLRTLCLDDTRVTGIGMKDWWRMAALRELSMHGCPITDASLEHIGRIEGLVRLHLGKTSITDAGISHLKRLRTLRVLMLFSTKVTGKGVEELRLALPGIIILSDVNGEKGGKASFGSP